MKVGIDEVINDFDNRANKIYSDLFEQFLQSTREINRENNENVFKLQMAKFLEHLKKKLDQQVRASSERYDGNEPQQLQGILATKVNYYLRQFRHKCVSW